MQQRFSERRTSYKVFQMSAKGGLLTGQLQHDSGSPSVPIIYIIPGRIQLCTVCDAFLAYVDPVRLRHALQAHAA